MFYLAVDGVDGIGKTTVLEHVASTLSMSGYSVISVSEPTDRTMISKFIAAGANDDMLAGAFFADRMLMLSSLRGESCDFLLSDRCLLSSIVYQMEASLDAMIKLSHMLPMQPDLIVVLVGENRDSKDMLSGLSRNVGNKDYLESIRYISANVRVIDCAGKTAQAVAAEIVKMLV